MADRRRCRHRAGAQVPSGPVPYPRRVRRVGEGMKETTRQSMPALTIVHVVSSLQVGGMEQFVLRIAERQRRQGHKVSVLALRGGPLLETAAAMGLSVHVLRGGNRLQRIFETVAYYNIVRPQIVHPHNRTSLGYALASKLTGNCRVVMTRHGQNAKRIPRTWEWRLTDRVIAVSEAAAKVMRQGSRFAGEKVVVILNGISCDKAQRSRAEVRKELGDTHEAVGIIVARIDHQKGHNPLLQALALLRDRKTPLTLLVAGDGANRAEMEQLAASLGLGPKDVRFLGFRKDIPDLLEASDIFLLPSLNEGLPLSVLEAMSHGLPVVATPVGGIPELVKNEESGYLVPMNDPEALATAIARLVSDPGLRRKLGDSGLNHVEKHFSFD